MKNIKSLTNIPRSIAAAIATVAIGSFATVSSFASGILTPIGSPQIPIELEEHHVRIVINNGFARTEVEQVFSNPNSNDLEAIFTTPIPEKAALSELQIDMEEKTINGEVVLEEDANRIYEEEKSLGNDAGKASQNAYQNFEFRVSRVPAKGTVRMHYAYYEPLTLDTGIGRYAYRIEEGGTDDEAQSFWTQNDVVKSQFSIDVTLNSAWPVANVRTPNFPGQSETLDDKTTHYHFAQSGTSNLNKDFVFYYKLQDNLPGRLELLAYRPTVQQPGTFMLLMTPGADLKPLTVGSDFIFAIDVSGSMNGKLHTLANGVSKAIQNLRPEDRYRIVPFNSRAWDLQAGWQNATTENISQSIEKIKTLKADQGTNLYEGISKGLRDLDSDRVSSLILVTDGVTNSGIVDPKKFYKLLHEQDVRFYGFLLGNSSNWPLMRLMCEASGGYYKSVSNSDDIIGEILLAKNKVAFESMHEATLKIQGIDTFDVSDFRIGKIHNGEQLVFFGKYDQSGGANITLDAKISGQERSYSTRFDFPEIATDYPELERMWALDQVQKIEIAKMAGLSDPDESDQAIADIGVAYQIVTEGTSMIALDDEAFQRHGIDRKNQDRIATERIAQSQRTQTTGAQRVDTQKPMYTNSAPSVGGGGAIEPWAAILVVAGGTFIWAITRKRNSSTHMALFVGTVALALFSQRAAHAAGNVHESIANFWQVSESEASTMCTEATIPQRPQTEALMYTPSNANRQSSLPDEHSVKQSETANQSNNHFGFKVFDRIHLFKFEWGHDDESQNNKYEGIVKR